MMPRRQHSLKVKLTNLAACLYLALGSGPAWAQVVLPLSVQQGEEEKLVSLNFRDAPLDVVLEHYAEVTGRTMIQSPGVAQVLVNLRGQQKLTETEFLAAIESVLALNNIALVPLGDKFLKVIPSAELRTHGMAITREALPADAPETDKLESRVIELQHLEIPEIQPIIDSLKHPYAKVQPLERANSLLITETTTNLKRILEIIELLDKPLATKMEVRIYELQYADVSEVSARLNELVQQSQQAQEQSRAGGRATPQPPTARGIIRAGTTAARTAADAASTAEERALAEQGLVQGTVTFVADERTNILIVISKPSNFVFFDKIVMVLDRPVEPEITVEVIALEYANAADLGGILNEFIGVATADSGSSSGARQGGDSAAAGQEGGSSRSTALEEYIRRRNEARSAIQRAQTATRGATTGEDASFGRLSEDTRILPDERTNSLLLMGHREDIRILRTVIDELDVMLAQVLIEALILEVQLGDDIEYGIDWLQRSFTVYNEETAGPGGGVSVREPVLAFGGAQRLNEGTSFLDGSQITRDTPFSPGALTYYATMFDLNIDAVIRLAASSSQARILSTPVILTTDNKEASLFIGESRPTVTSTSITGGGVDRSTYQYTEIGIRLELTPHINPQRFVVLEINQEANNVGGFEIIDGNRVPIITERSLQAEIAVQHRSTVVLGGMVDADQRKGRTKVPILGDIPILGSLFRYDSESENKTELIVLITPYVMMSPEETLAEAQRLYDRTFASEKLPGHTWSDTPVLWKPDASGQEPLSPLFDRSGRTGASIEAMGASGRQLADEGIIDAESLPFDSEELGAAPSAAVIAPRMVTPAEAEVIKDLYEAAPMRARYDANMQTVVVEAPAPDAAEMAPAAVKPTRSEVLLERGEASGWDEQAPPEVSAPPTAPETPAPEPAEAVVAPPPAPPLAEEVAIPDVVSPPPEAERLPGDEVTELEDLLGLDDPVPLTRVDNVPPSPQVAERPPEEPETAPAAESAETGSGFTLRMGPKEGVPPLDQE